MVFYSKFKLKIIRGLLRVTFFTNVTNFAFIYLVQLTYDTTHGKCAFNNSNSFNSFHTFGLKSETLPPYASTKSKTLVRHM